MTVSTEAVCDAPGVLSAAGNLCPSSPGREVVCEPLLYSLLNGDCWSGIHTLPEPAGNAPFKQLLYSLVRLFHVLQ